MHLLVDARDGLFFRLPSMTLVRVIRGRTARGLFALLSLLPLAACVSASSHDELAAAEPVFSPLTFFAGRTAGDGVLRVVFSPARPVRVAGDGHVEDDGTLILTQKVEEGDKPARSRVWRLHAVGGGRFAGTLSDATGPVAGDVHGNLLHLKFTAKGGLGMEQWLYLQPDGRTVFNRMVVRKFGFPVASLSETIRRVS